MEKSLHVSRFCPTHIADGIIASLLLICRIVSARPIGTRNSEVKFLLKVELALDVHANCSDRHHNAAIACYFSGHIHRFAAGGFSRDQDGVRAMSVRMLQA